MASIVTTAATNPYVKTAVTLGAAALAGGLDQMIGIFVPAVQSNQTWGPIALIALSLAHNWLSAQRARYQAQAANTAGA